MSVCSILIYVVLSDQHDSSKESMWITEELLVVKKEEKQSWNFD